MNLELNSDPSLTPDANPAGQAAEWHDHEHVADQVQLAAQQLVEQAGSPELAKHAIEVVEKRQTDSSGGDSQQIPPTSPPATFERNDPTGSRIDVRSVSRVGKSDLGTNARRINAYLARVK